MKVGDLVREKRTGKLGIVERIDENYYGSDTSFTNLYREIERGLCMRSDLADGIVLSKRGKRDRVLVCWTDEYPEYLESTELEAANESR